MARTGRVLPNHRALDAPRQGCRRFPSLRGTRVVNAFAIGAFLLLLLAALFVSRRNLRAGRGDRRGALQLGAFAAVGQMIAWAFNDPHIANSSIEVQRFFESVGESLFAGGTLYMMYLAVEPAVRRYWPDSLLGWTRLLRGRFIDARVGRDVLVGLAAGAVMQLLISARLSFQALAGSPSLPLSAGNLRFFEGPTYVLGFFTSLLAFQAMFNAMWCIFAIVGLMRLLKRMWLVGIAASVLFAFIAANDIFIGASGATWINFLVALAVVGIIISVAIRVGLLATAAAFLASFVVSATPWTFDSTDWYFPSSALSLLLMCALAVTAGFAARAGQARRSIRTCVRELKLGPTCPRCARGWGVPLPHGGGPERGWAIRQSRTHRESGSRGSARTRNETRSPRW